MITIPLAPLIIGLITIIGSLLALLYNRVSGRLREIEVEQKTLRGIFEITKDSLKESDWSMREKNLELLNIIHKDFVKKQECKEINSKKANKNE